MNEKALEKITGLSRRQIIMLQKYVIERKGKIIVGISYDYSDDEVELFILAKMFKDVGYTYPEIKKEMDEYENDKIKVLNKAILKMNKKINDLNKTLEIVKKLKEKEEK